MANENNKNVVYRSSHWNDVNGIAAKIRDVWEIDGTKAHDNNNSLVTHSIGVRCAGYVKFSAHNRRNACGRSSPADGSFGKCQNTGGAISFSAGLEVVKLSRDERVGSPNPRGHNGHPCTAARFMRDARNVASSCALKSRCSGGGGRASSAAVRQRHQSRVYLDARDSLEAHKVQHTGGNPADEVSPFALARLDRGAPTVRAKGRRELTDVIAVRETRRQRASDSYAIFRAAALPR